MALKMIFKLGSLALVLALSPALRADEGEALVKSSDCLTCHAVNRKVVGPAYLEVAKKYKGANAATIKKLVQKVKAGGAGNWGAVPMAAHPALADADIEKMVKWVLSRTPQAVAAEAAAAAKAAPAPAAAPKPTASEGAKKEEAPKGKKRRVSHLANEEPEETLAFSTDEEVRHLMEKQDCYGCHSGVRRDGMAEDMPWPSFAKIEAKLKNGKDLQPIVKKIHSGEGKESWGKIPHPRYEHLPVEAVDAMVAYVAAGKASKGLEAKDPNAMGAEEWMRKAADCFSCHAVNVKNVGPAYKDVAKKYAGAGPAQIKALVKKVKEGGSGNWGNVAMAAHPNATDAQLEKAVRWVLEQK
jgi:cytochrome c